MVWNADLIVCGITVVGSLVITCVTYWKIKRLKFYETFFAEKVKAYSEFLDTVSNAIQGEEPSELKKAIAAQMKVKLYCSQKALPEIVKVMDALMKMENPDDPEDLTSFGLKYDDAVAVFRKDLHDCRKFKFE